MEVSKTHPAPPSDLCLHVQIADASANTAILEVSVTYLTTTVDPVTLTCNGVTITLSGGTSGVSSTKCYTFLQ